MSDELDKSRNKKKRALFQFAGNFFLVSLIEKLFLGSTQAQTWQKIGNPTGAAGTWQKLALAGSTNPARLSGVACGSSHTLAFRSDGTVFVTVYNNYGQLGDNTLTTKRTFIQIT